MFRVEATFPSHFALIAFFCGFLAPFSTQAAMPDLTPTLRAVEFAVAQRDAILLDRVATIDTGIQEAIRRFLVEFRPRLNCQEAQVTRLAPATFQLSADCQIATFLLGRRLERGPVPIQWEVTSDPEALHGFRVTDHNLKELLLPLDSQDLTQTTWGIFLTLIVIALISVVAFAWALVDFQLSHRKAWLAALVLLAPLSSVIYLFLRNDRARTAQN